MQGRKGTRCGKSSEWVDLKEDTTDPTRPLRVVSGTSELTQPEVGNDPHDEQTPETRLQWQKNGYCKSCLLLN